MMPADDLASPNESQDVLLGNYDIFMMFLMSQITEILYTT